MSNSCIKKITLSLSFVINVALLLLMAFLSNFWIYLIISAITFVVFVVILSFNKYIQNKMLFLLLTTMLPIFGTTIYLFGKFNYRYLHSRSVYQGLEFRNKEDFDSEECLRNIRKHNLKQYKIHKNFDSTLDAPVFQNSTTKFLEGGEQIFDELLFELQQAKNYIFIEQYVIKDGEIWKKIFKTLKEKAREGVEIKILYDPIGCKDAFYDKLTFKKLANYKIDAIPFKTGVFGFGNHRKMVVIDGVVGFVGSINISDRYTHYGEINNNWELSAVKISGDAVWNMAIGFYNDWVFSKGRVDYDYIHYKPEGSLKLKTNDIVQPVNISPLNNDDEVKNLLINMINSANERIDIFSSFVNIDNDILETIKRAVNSGVEVNIVLSSSTDRKVNFALSKGQYYSLISVGANVMEYNNSFIRSRMIIVDNETAFIGSVGFDTRWLHLKYENGALITSKETLKNISKYVENIKFNSKQVGIKDIKERPFSIKFINWLLKFLRIYY